MILKSLVMVDLRFSIGHLKLLKTNIFNKRKLFFQRLQMTVIKNLAVFEAQTTALINHATIWPNGEK